MSFWKSELGQVSGEQKDAFTATFKSIPDGTKALAQIKEFKNKEFKSNDYLEVQWLLTEGDFKGLHVFQKIKVFDPDPKARHRGLNMLMLLYKMFNQKPKDAEPPTDSQLRVFVGKAAGIKIQETPPNDQGKVYNWVSEIHKAEGFKCESGISSYVAPRSFSAGAPPESAQIAEKEEPDDEIPF